MIIRIQRESPVIVGVVRVRVEGKGERNRKWVILSSLYILLHTFHTPASPCHSYSSRQHYKWKWREKRVPDPGVDECQCEKWWGQTSASPPFVHQRSQTLKSHFPPLSRTSHESNKNLLLHSFRIFQWEMGNYVTNHLCIVEELALRVAGRGGIWLFTGTSS